MGGTSLYDEDVYAWSEQQAAALRRLAQRHDLPNDLDLLHVAEEIEDVGASQLREARSLIRLILTHAIKCWADPEAPSVLHWAAEIRNWHNDLADRLTPAMAVKIDMTDLWRRAAQQADLDLLAYGREPARERLQRGLAEASCLITLDDLTDDAMTAEGLVKRIAAGATHPG